jgi:hypothetical protein
MNLARKDLGPAYDKAAWNFQGKMRQNFAVLQDQDEAGGATRMLGPNSGRWRGRGGGGGKASNRGSGAGPRTGTKRSFERKEPEGKIQKR